jgi:serine protease Do
VRVSREASRTVVARVQALFALAIGLGLGLETSSVDAAVGLSAAIAEVQPKCVKIYGAGGFRGLEAYQSGFLISAEGHVLTAHSYVLDADYITCTLDDGQKFEAKFIGADPRLEVAVLKIEGKDLPHFDLTKAVSASEGTSVLAFSNLFGVAVGDEPVSVLHGVVAAITSLDARRGVFQTMYRGQVLVVDAMTNNPGAAGGALTNTRGELLGMLGKELRNSRNNTWLNYAIPIAELTETIDRIRAGKAPPVGNDRPDKPLANPLTLEALGIVMVPAVLERTPPFVDKVRAGSPAARAGIAADDIVLFVDEQLIQSSQSFVKVLERIEINEPLRLTVMRKTTIVDVTLELTEEEVALAVAATKNRSSAEGTTDQREK